MDEMTNEIYIRKLGSDAFVVVPVAIFSVSEVLLVEK